MKNNAILSAAIALVISFSAMDVKTAGRKELVVSSRIDRVMVYHDRALVTREAVIKDLKPGTYDIIFKNLPAMVQDDSVRAKSYNTDAIKIRDVEVKSFQLENVPEKKIRLLQERLQALKDQKRNVTDRLNVLSMEKQYLNGAQKSFLESALSSQAGGDRTRTGSAVQRLKVGDYEAMLQYLNRKYKANAGETFEQEKQLRLLKRRINLVSGKLSKLHGGHSSLAKKKLVKVTIENTRPVTFKLELSYINKKINWNPGYDIRVMEKSSETEFTGYGIVSQSSGEDWNNTRMSFSTAQPAARGWLPELVPLYATFSTKIPRRTRKSYGKKYLSQQAMNRAVLDNEENIFRKERKGRDSSVTESASVSATERKVGSLVFHVPKRSTIPSDGSPHRTAISRQVFPVRFEYLSIPKLSPHAYLQAIGRNNMKAPILRGDLNIYMGNDFVGSSYTDNILPGEDFELTLSVNENIRVKRTLEEKEQKTAGFLRNTKKTSYSFLIKIENYSGRDIIMNILDQIPVSETEDIKIENIKFSHKPAKRNKKGIAKWQFKMKPRETINLTFSFTVSVAKEKDVGFFKTRMPPSYYLQNQSVQEKELREMDDRKRKKKTPAMRQKMF